MPYRPAVFFVLDATSRLHFFNLLDRENPIHVESVQDSKIVDVDTLDAVQVCRLREMCAQM
jgi:hypothetical protein